MTSQLLTRRSHRDRNRPALPFLGDLSLPLARVHELCGNARRTLAVMIAGALQGPVYWIAPAWQAETLNPGAALRFIDPARLTFLSPTRAEDLLWCMEEVLRSGAVPLAIADLPRPPGLTPVRRLHLAAETGAEATGTRPLGLLLTPGEGGAQGTETRWHMAAAHTADGAEGWRLSRRRARTAPVAEWHVAPGPAGHRLTALPSGA